MKKDKSPFEKLRAKYLCKLYEGLAHLLCEPLLFDWAEELIDEAEFIYLKSKKHLFTDFDVIKFMLKKSSFLKKYGFFDDSLKLLDQLNTQLNVKF